MKKLNTSPISGTQELLPAEQATFDQLKATVQDVFHRHGFMNIETPMLERQEILLAKAGGDTEKQIYKVFKTAESADEATEALRFDHTVPLARYVVQHEQDLAFPFKVAQTGENFRGERAQKGRFREFYQCDVDVIGRGELSLFYDYDVVATLLDTYRRFGLSTPVLARLSHRKIMTGLLEALHLEDKSREIFSIIDHAEKVPQEKTVSALESLNLSSSEIAKLTAFINLHGSRKKVILNLRALNLASDTFRAGVDELDVAMSLLEQDGYEDAIEADMKIIRGLDYYTGLVFEFILPEHRDIGSIGGGGRYDNLTAYFAEQPFPGVGGSIGLNRLYYVLRERGLIATSAAKPLDLAVVPVTNAELPYAMKVASDLRNSGLSVTIVATEKKLPAKLAYAANLAAKGIVLGESEVASGSYEIKEFH